MSEKDLIKEILPLIYHRIDVTVQKAVKTIIEESVNQNINFDSKEAAKYLKMSIDGLYKNLKKIPHSKNGKRKYIFTKTELDKYIQDNKVMNK